MTDEQVTPLMFEGAQLVFRNFAGKEGQYNREGDRNFSIILPPEDATRIEALGWNVKYLNPREEGDDPVPYLTVTVSYKYKAPKVVLISSRARTNLDEASVSVLDWTEIGNADLIIRPYEWTVNGKSGIKAYLQSMFVTMEEDALERKYAISDGDNP